MSLKIVAISDTHEKHNQLVLPQGDVLVHAGDLTNNGSLAALEKVAKWFEKQPFSKKVIICGNHDFGFENYNHDKAVKLFEDVGVIYLQDSSVVIDDIKFYGSPWQPWFHNWAFNLPRGVDNIGKKWTEIPEDTNVLITHGPPYGILDLVEDNDFNFGRDRHQGCEALSLRVKELSQLKVHIFGHLHLCGGYSKVVDNVTFANAAICTENYKPTNSPLVIEVSK